MLRSAVGLRKLLTRLFQEDPGPLLPGGTTSRSHRIAKSQDFSLLLVSVLYAKIHAKVSFSSGRKSSKIIAIKQKMCSLLSHRPHPANAFLSQLPRVSQHLVQKCDHVTLLPSGKTRETPIPKGAKMG